MRAHSFTTTMLRLALRTTRSAVRQLTDSKTPRKPTLLNTWSLYQQHPPIYSSLTLQNQIFAANTSVPTLRLQKRQFTTTCRNSARYLRSGDRPKKSNGDLPRRARKANIFLPFQASSFVDAFVTTIVGVGISESCGYECVGASEVESFIL